MKKVFFFPPCPPNGYENPYSIHYKASLSSFFDVAELDNPPTKVKSLTLFHYALKSDVFILNWIENAIYWKFGILQFFLVVFSLRIIRFRNKKIVWMFHNMNPHEGKSFFSNYITSFLLKNASLIISHSKDATAKVRLMASCQVEYLCHPVCSHTFDESPNLLTSCDVFIWGSILPYKGVAEFLEKAKESLRNKKIIILGKCTNPCLKKRILSLLTPNVVFMDRFASFGEIAAYVSKTQYVLFPYIGDCVSSSGVLMDTIAMGGGMPVGPDKGAFKDMAEEGACITYKSYEELFAILEKDAPRVDMKTFAKKNSWSCFALKLAKLIENEL